MEHPKASQRDDRASDGDPDTLGDPVESADGTPRSQSSTSQAMIDSLLSDYFKDKLNKVLDELPVGDYRRANVLYMIGGQFNLHYTRTGSPILLDNAISYTERALEELPKPHEELETYVVVYTHFLQQKAERSGTLGDAEDRLEVADQYIAGLKLGIGYLQESSLKEEKKRELGCAYWGRFGVSEHVEDLARAIETLEACFENANQVFPQAAIYLGSALRQRYDYEKSLTDLDRSVELLRKGLEAIPRDKDHYAPLRAYGLGVLISDCAKINSDDASDDIRSRAIHSVEIVLSSIPTESEAVARLRQQHLNLVMMECFKEPESMEELFDTLKLGLDEELTANPGSRVVANVPPTVDKLFTQGSLADNKKEIRLVELLPGSKDDFVQCEILVKRLDGALDYEVGDQSRQKRCALLTLVQALSYVWGSPKETVDICVNGYRHAVTKNLYSALLRLRHTETARILWIDALCINQNDLDEKRHQIGLMRDIYRNAGTVIMWLGEPESEDQTVAPKEEKPDQTSDQRSKPLTGERSTEVEKADVAPENEPESEPSSEVPDPLVSPKYPVGGREIEILMKEFTWLKPVLFGCKPVSRVSMSVKDASWFSSVAKDILKQIELDRGMSLLFHNTRFRRLPGPKLQVFDWTSPNNIISFFRSPQSPSMWPVLGAFALIRSFAQLSHFSELPFFGGVDTDLSYPNRQTWIKSAKALDTILSSGYWERAWILQEVVLAQKPIIHYGPHIMHLNELLHAGQVFQIHYHKCCSQWGDKAYLSSHTYWYKLSSEFRKFEELYRLRRAHGAPPINFVDSLSSEPPSHSTSTPSRKPNPELSLTSIMRTGIAKRKATDPRDLVYGILGLVDGDTGIEADYTASLGEVFARAAAHMMREAGSLHVLTLNDLGRRAEHALPSWVPDWTSSGMFCPQPYAESLYKADKGRSYYAELEDGLRLRVRSVKVDTIKKVSEMRTVSWKHPSKLVELLREWRSMAGLDPPNQIGGGDYANLEDTFWRAVFADVIAEHEREHQASNDGQEGSSDNARRFEPRDSVKVRAWWDWLQGEADPSASRPDPEWHSLRTRSHPDGFHIVTNSFWCATETRKMVFAESGRMGMGPSEFGNYIEFGDTRVGDEVHVLFGLSVPVILRVLEKERLSTEGAKRYRFVGPCFLHDVMDGQAMEDGNGAVEEILLC